LKEKLSPAVQEHHFSHKIWSLFLTDLFPCAPFFFHHINSVVTPAVSYIPPPNQAAFRVMAKLISYICIPNHNDIRISSPIDAVIYYNTLLLSRVYEKKLGEGDQAAIELMRRISPIA
jgi:hypothetical protein